MTHKTLSSLYYVAFLICPTVYCLTCLSCERISQPRHCHFVATCRNDESIRGCSLHELVNEMDSKIIPTREMMEDQIRRQVCGAEKLPASGDYQYEAYKLGCIPKRDCNNDTGTNGTLCNGCCSGDLCNAGLCGEPDYPMARGPICFDCQFHTDRQPCRHIEFCSSDEECYLRGVEEFGEVALKSGCKPKYSCPAPEQPPSVLVGKRSVLHQRSAGSAVCEMCCAKDLCNLNCSAANQCSHASCRHGTCVSINSTTTCQCLPGWKGPICNEVDHCTPSPCQQGVCSTTATSFICSCFLGWAGRTCNTSELNCDFEVDTCTWNQSTTDQMEWYRQSGYTPSSNTGPSGDHTTGHGYYIYIEASSGSQGSKADLISKHLPPSSTYCLELALNMYGSTMGSVDIYIQPEKKTMFEIQHFKQIVNSQTWMVKNVTIPPQPHKFSIVIEGVKGSGYYSDAAIDDIKLFLGPCD